jgi:hypothetical protein
MKMINYNKVSEMQNFKPLKVISQKEQSISIEDESLKNYYMNRYERKLVRFFIHKISDSNTYIIIFPTGLLLMVAYNPMTIQYKLQLNLKKDETLIDFVYCVSNDQEYHCIWMLDEKQ